MKHLRSFFGHRAAVLVFSILFAAAAPVTAAATAPRAVPISDSQWWYCTTTGADHQTLYMSGLFEGDNGYVDSYRSGFAGYIAQQYNESPQGTMCWMSFDSQAANASWVRRKESWSLGQVIATNWTY